MDEPITTPPGDEQQADDATREGVEGADSAQRSEINLDEIRTLKRQLAEKDASLATATSTLNDLQNMLTDPARLEQMAQGHGAATRTNPADDYTGFEDVTDPKEMARKLEGRVMQRTEQMTNTQVQQLIKQYENLRVKFEIAQAEAKYPDFNNYRDAMANLARQQRYAGLSAGDLYALAKRPDFSKAESELAKRKKQALAAGSNEASSTATSPVAEALKGKEGSDITGAIYDLMQSGEGLPT